MRALAVVVVLGCSAPATLSELTVAERRADAGDVDGALASYRAAQARCGALRPARRATAACSEALLGEAEVLDHAGRTPAAIEAYLAIASKTADPTPAAIGLYRGGELLLRAGQVAPAWAALWRVVTDYPDEPTAGDALRRLLRDGRHRDPRALADEIARVLTQHAETQLADNLLWSLADLEEHELGDLAAARALYDRIPIDTPASGMRDDARWHAARISRLMGDPEAAVTRLRGLLATREVAWFTGSYFSVWLDDAQLLLGQLLRDELHDLPGAIAAFRQLPRDYPASILRDDALYELAVTQDRAGDHPAACATLAQLGRDFADSKYVARGKALCPP